MRFSIFTILLLFVSIMFQDRLYLLDKTYRSMYILCKILKTGIRDGGCGTTDIEGNLPQDLNDEGITIQHIAYNPENVESYLYLRKILLFI